MPKGRGFRGYLVIIVSGVLPLHLAVLASTVTEVPLNLLAELRGVELTAY